MSNSPVRTVDEVLSLISSKEAELNRVPAANTAMSRQTKARLNMELEGLRQELEELRQELSGTTQDGDRGSPSRVPQSVSELEVFVQDLLSEEEFDQADFAVTSYQWPGAGNDSDPQKAELSELIERRRSATVTRAIEGYEVAVARQLFRDARASVERLRRLRLPDNEIQSLEQRLADVEEISRVRLRVERAIQRVKNNCQLDREPGDRDATLGPVEDARSDVMELIGDERYAQYHSRLDAFLGIAVAESDRRNQILKNLQSVRGMEAYDIQLKLIRDLQRNGIEYVDQYGAENVVIERGVPIQIEIDRILGLQAESAGDFILQKVSLAGGALDRGRVAEAKGHVSTDAFDLAERRVKAFSDQIKLAHVVTSLSDFRAELTARITARDETNRLLEGAERRLRDGDLTQAIDHVLIASQRDPWNDRIFPVVAHIASTLLIRVSTIQISADQRATLDRAKRDIESAERVFTGLERLSSSVLGNAESPEHAEFRSDLSAISGAVSTLRGTLNASLKKVERADEIVKQLEELLRSGPGSGNGASLLDELDAMGLVLADTASLRQRVAARLGREHQISAAKRQLAIGNFENAIPTLEELNSTAPTPEMDRILSDAYLSRDFRACERFFDRYGQFLATPDEATMYGLLTQLAACDHVDQVRSASLKATVDQLRERARDAEFNLGRLAEFQSQKRFKDALDICDAVIKSVPTFEARSHRARREVLEAWEIESERLLAVALDAGDASRLVGCLQEWRSEFTPLTAHKRRDSLFSALRDGARSSMGREDWAQANEYWKWCERFASTVDMIADVRNGVSWVERMKFLPVAKRLANLGRWAEARASIEQIPTAAEPDREMQAVWVDILLGEGDITGAKAKAESSGDEALISQVRGREEQHLRGANTRQAQADIESYLSVRPNLAMCKRAAAMFESCMNNIVDEPDRMTLSSWWAGRCAQQVAAELSLSDAALLSQQPVVECVEPLLRLKALLSHPVTSNLNPIPDHRLRDLQALLAEEARRVASRARQCLQRPDLQETSNLLVSGKVLVGTIQQSECNMPMELSMLKQAIQPLEPLREDLQKLDFILVEANNILNDGQINARQLNKLSTLVNDIPVRFINTTLPEIRTLKTNVKTLEELQIKYEELRNSLVTAWLQEQYQDVGKYCYQLENAIEENQNKSLLRMVEVRDEYARQSLTNLQEIRHRAQAKVGYVVTLRGMVDQGIRAGDAAHGLSLNSAEIDRRLGRARSLLTSAFLTGLEREVSAIRQPIVSALRNFTQVPDDRGGEYRSRESDALLGKFVQLKKSLEDGAARLDRLETECSDAMAPFPVMLQRLNEAVARWRRTSTRGSGLFAFFREPVDDPAKREVEVCFQECFAVWRDNPELIDIRRSIDASTN